MASNTSNKTIMISGCGGGYDIFGGLPLYFKMTSTAKKIILVNFSFTDQQTCDVLTEHKMATKLDHYLYRMIGYEHHDGVSSTFCPEARLATCLNHPVYAILIHENPTLSDLARCYDNILKEEGPIDTIYLVDGGCDVLLRGNERALATPVEDMMHLKIIRGLQIPEKFVMAVGVDVDIADGVDPADLDERLRRLEPIKIHEWCWNLTDPLISKYRDIVLKCQPINSIVQSLIIASLEGHTGNFVPGHLKNRIRKSKITLSPRLCTAFIYPLDRIADDVLYLDLLTPDLDTEQVDDLIGEFHHNLIHKSIPSIS